jgi:cytochrome P450
VSIGAANRDPRQYPHPHRLDITRKDAAKNLAFSGGMHYCVGASLARLELQIAFTTLFRRIRNIRIADGFEVTWRKGHTLRMFDSLPITFDAIPEASKPAAREAELQPNSS